MLLSCLRGQPTERTYLTAPLPTLSASRYVPPGQSAKFGCNYLMAKSHPKLLNPKNGNFNAKRYEPDDLVQKIAPYPLIIVVPYVILLITLESVLRPHLLL